MNPDDVMAKMPPNIVAYIIDNEVVQVLYLDDFMTAVVLSEPLVINVTDQGRGVINKGDTYDPETGTFSRPI